MSGLSARLQAIAERIPTGSRVADVGTDHGLLVRWLVQHRHVARAIASDIAPRPLEAARRNLAPWRTAVDVRLGHGLSVLEAGEVDVVVIAGMGGHRTLRLTEGPPDLLDALRLLVLQPNDGWPRVRAAIRDRCWSLVDETLVEDGGKFYVVFAVAPRPPEAIAAWSEADLILGPVLRRRRGPAWERWLVRRLSQIEAARAQARRATSTTDPRVQKLDRMRAIVLEAMAEADARVTAGG